MFGKTLNTAIFEVWSSLQSKLSLGGLISSKFIIRCSESNSSSGVTETCVRHQADIKVKQFHKYTTHHLSFMFKHFLPTEDCNIAKTTGLDYLFSYME